jgi:hypothetical protein
MIDPAALLTAGASPEPFRHYPDGDAYDLASHCQFYFHTHRMGEQGHFHLFMRPAGMPAGIVPAVPAAQADAPCHLVAVALGDGGRVVELFTTNRWVTGEAWYPADQIARMLPCFSLDIPGPAGVVGRWLTGLVERHRTLIVQLAELRDDAVSRWSTDHPDADPLDSAELEVLSRAPIADH